MGKIFINTLLLVLLSSWASAQSLVPATSEDLNEFDQQISQSTRKNTEKEKSGKAANFGALVSEKAKDLKTEELDQKKKMGQWVSEQRKKGAEKVPAANEGRGANGNSSSSGKDAKTSSPVNNDRGNSETAPGHSGNRKK